MDCPLCKRTFVAQSSLNNHLRTSSRHTHCKRCKRGFQSDTDFQKHLQHATAHLVSPVTATPAAQVQALAQRLLVYHQSEHRRPVVVATPEDYVGIPSQLIKPVFTLACRLRFRSPTTETIIRQSGTTLDTCIVAAILEAALRLLPPDKTPEGTADRVAKAKIRAERALMAEHSFVDHFTGKGYSFLDELAQKARISSRDLLPVRIPTPDILFNQPTTICGHVCHWVEYKVFFGFRANPFVANKVKKQVKRYVTEIGPGMLVYKLGFEIDHLIMEGVKVLREEELLKMLEEQPR